MRDDHGCIYTERTGEELEIGEEKEIWIHFDMFRMFVILS